MTGAREVVITGAASLGAHGLGLDPLAAALGAGRPLARPLRLAAGPGQTWRCRESAHCPDLDLSPWLTPRAARRMSTLSRWAVALGKIALEQGEWPIAAGSSDARLGVCFASCFGPSGFVNQLLGQILREGPRAASPFLFTDCVANAPAGQLAVAVGARAGNFTISQREAGPLLAVIQADREIRGGRADAMLVGSADELDANQITVLDRMRAIASRGQEVAPFDRHRRGILIGEGGSCLLVEAGERAAARGATPLARLVATARAFDPTASRASWGSGYSGLVARLAHSLEVAGVEPGSIDLVVSGASGSRAGDRLEALTLRGLFGADLPPVLTPKAVVGEYGAGGVMVPGILALRGGQYLAPAACQEPDPELGVALRTLNLTPPRRVLVTSLASGGAAAWLVLESAG